MQPGLGKTVNDWVKRNSAGREKAWIGYMFLAALLMMGLLVFLKLRSPVDREEVDLIDALGKPVRSSKNDLNSVWETYSELNEAEDALELLQEYEKLINAEELDTVRILEVQKELNKYLDDEKN